MSSPETLAEIQAYVVCGEPVPAHLVAQLLAAQTQTLDYNAMQGPKRASPEVMAFGAQLIANYRTGVAAYARLREGGGYTCRPGLSLNSVHPEIPQK